MSQPQDFKWKITGTMSINGTPYQVSSVRMDLTQNALPSLICSFNLLSAGAGSSVVNLDMVLGLYAGLAALENGAGRVSVNVEALPPNDGQPSIGPTVLRVSDWPILRVGLVYGETVGFSLTAVHPAWLAMTSAIHMMGSRREYLERAITGASDVWGLILAAMDTYRGLFGPQARIAQEKLKAYDDAIAGLRKYFVWSDSAKYPVSGMPRTTVIDWPGALAHSVKHAVMSAQEVAPFPFLVRMAQLYDFVIVPTYDEPTLALAPFRPWSTPLDIDTRGWSMRLSSSDDQQVGGISHNLRETGLDRLTTNPDLLASDTYREDIIYSDPDVRGPIHEYGVPAFIASAVTYTNGVRASQAAGQMADDVANYPVPNSGQTHIGEGVARPDDSRLWSELMQAAELSARQLYSEAYRRGQQMLLVGPFRTGVTSVGTLYPGMTVRLKRPNGGPTLRTYVQRITHVIDRAARLAQTEIVGAYACPESAVPKIVAKGANLYYGS